jgi:hypothetical protein
MQSNRKIPHDFRSFVGQVSKLSFVLAAVATVALPATGWKPVLRRAETFHIATLLRNFTGHSRDYKTIPPNLGSAIGNRRRSPIGLFQKYRSVNYS